MASGQISSIKPLELAITKEHTAIDSGDWKCYRSGHVNVFSGFFHITSNISGGKKLFTIGGANFKPLLFQVFAVCGSSDNYKQGKMRIESSGSVYADIDLINGLYYSFDITFLS